MIRETITGYRHTHRAEITRQVCERLQWVDARGRPEIAAALRRFHRKGWIELPPPRSTSLALGPLSLPEDLRPPARPLARP